MNILKLILNGSDRRNVDSRLARSHSSGRRSGNNPERGRRRLRRLGRGARAKASRMRRSRPGHRRWPPGPLQLECLSKDSVTLARAERHLGRIDILIRLCQIWFRLGRVPRSPLRQGHLHPPLQGHAGGDGSRGRIHGGRHGRISTIRHPSLHSSPLWKDSHNTADRGVVVGNNYAHNYADNYTNNYANNYARFEGISTIRTGM